MKDSPQPKLLPPALEPQLPPSPKTEQLYKVQEKDSITSIAFKFGMSINVLKRINRLGDFMVPGQIIKVLTTQGNPNILNKKEDTIQLPPPPPLVRGRTQTQKRSMSDQMVTQTIQRSKSGEFQFQEIKEDQANEPLVTEPRSIPGVLSYNRLEEIVNHSRENFIGVLKVKQTYQQDREWVERTGSFLHDANALYQQRAQSLESAEEINPKEAEELRYQAHVQEEEDEFNNKFIKTQTYYCTMLGDVKGLITITDYLIMFDPLDCPENEVNEINSALSKFHVCIDVHDVVECQELTLPNKMAADFEELALQEAYKFDYYLNFIVSTVNGKLTRRSKSVRKHNSTDMIEVE